jgi:hypothetical protein
LENAEQRRRWYRDARNVITGIWVLISISSFIFAYSAKSADEMRSKREELRKTIAIIIDLNTASHSFGSGQSYSAINFLADNTKKEIYVESAESLVRQMPYKVSSQEYRVLADYMELIGNYKKQEYYGEQAVRVSTDIYSKCYALRDLAYFYFSKDHTDIKKGREYFEKVVDLLSKQKDDFMLHLLGDTYRLWGIKEAIIDNGFENYGGQKINLARKYYSDISDSRRRDYTIKNLEDSVKEFLDNKEQTGIQDEFMKSNWRSLPQPPSRYSTEQKQKDKTDKSKAGSKEWRKLP